jgi:hypothetical protein
MFGQLTFGQMT